MSEVQEAAPSVLRVMHVVYALEPGGMEYGVLKLVNGLDPQGAASRLRVEREFALTETTQQYEALYRRLVDARLRAA